MKKYFFIIIACLFLSASNAQSFSTHTATAIMGKKDVMEVEYVAEDVSVEQFQLPDFNNWIVVSGPNMSSTNIVTGNQLKRKTVYSVLLQPTLTGKQVIPGASALINNKPRTSNPVMVMVKTIDHVSAPPSSHTLPQTPVPEFLEGDDIIPRSQYLKKGENATQKIKNNILVRLEISKSTCFVGEPILATYKLCSRLKSTSKVIKQPMFTGCTVVELTDNDMSSTIENINGVPYNVFIIRRVQLIPLHKGFLTLPPALVENTVDFYDEGSLNFRDIFYDKPTTPAQQHTVNIENKPLSLEVMDLPSLPAGLPSFSGAIGHFDIFVSANRDQMSTNTSNALIVAIAGTGNLQNVKAPTIAWPKEVEGFEASEKIQYDKSVYPIKVYKTFTYPFVVEKKGSYQIPSVAFTYLDPASRQYVSKNSSSLALSIAQGNKKFFRSPSLTDVPFVQNPFYIIIGSVLMGLLVFIFWRNAKKTATVPVKQVIAPSALANDHTQPAFEKENYLLKVRALEPVSNPSLFYKDLDKIIQSFLKEKYHTTIHQLPDLIAQQTDKKEMLQELKALTDKCNLALYTPILNLEDALQDRLQAINIMMNLDQP